MQGGLRHAGTCLPAELGGEEHRAPRQAAGGPGGFVVVETRCHRGVKPLSKRQTDREQGAGFVWLREHAGRQAAEEKRKKSHGASQGGAERKRSCRGKTQKPVPSQKVCETKDVAWTREN